MAIVLIGWAVSTSPADGVMVGVAKCEERRRDRSDTVEETGVGQRSWSFVSNKTLQSVAASNSANSEQEVSWGQEGTGEDWLWVHCD